MRALTIERWQLSGRNLLTLGLALVFAVSTAVAFVPVQKASADTGCRVKHFYKSDLEYYNGYYRTDPRYTPYSSTCRHIHIVWESVLPPLGQKYADFRIRYYPTSGGSFVDTQGWTAVYSNGQTHDSYRVTIGTNVLNGTKYRIEVKNRTDFVAHD